MSFRLATSLAAMLFAAACFPALAQQDARGTVVGRVVDPTGAPVPAVGVRAVNTATGVIVAIQSNDQGNFALPYLIPGIYTVSAEATGFKKFIRDNIQVRVGDTVELNISMTLGDVAEQIEVRAESPLLSTAEASLGQVVDQRRVLELPLFSGNAMEFALLAPGTVNGTDMRLRKAAFNNAPSQFSTDGSGMFNNEFSIDGVTNTFSDSVNVRVAFSPPQAAIAEFKVQTSVFDASMGHTPGAQVNVSTKGGTNDIHGSAWWWLRHSDLDTPTIFQNRSYSGTGRKMSVYQDNRYGLSGGGPVVLPKLYNGKNKTFWHFTWEANKFGDPNVGASTSSVPKDAWRNGDLSDLRALGANYQVYDPATIALEASGRYTRQPFANNIIPASRIDPIAKKILDLYPRPNQAGLADGRNNYFVAGKAIEDYWTTIGRVDHTLSDKDRMFVRFHRDYWQEDKNRSFSNSVNGIILNRINRGLAFDEVHVFSAAFVLNFRYGLSQQEFPEHRVSQGFDLASLGFAPAFVNLFPKQTSAIPNTSVGSLTTLSPSESGEGVASSLSHTFTGNFTWMRGNHSIRFGPEFRLYRVFSDRHSADNAPILQFSNVWGKGPNELSTAPPVGGELVSLLLGIPGGSATRSGSFAQQDKYYALYIQDDWKLTRKLTINLGMRAEHESPVTERFDRSATQFLADQPSPIAAQAISNYAKSPIAQVPVASFKVNGGLSFAGVNGNPREFWNGQNLVWNPRIGIAYQATPLTVLRAGYGVFYGSIGSFKSSSNLAGFSLSTPIEATSDNGLTFKTKLSNPLPNGLLAPLGPNGGMSTNLGLGISFFAKDRKQSYAQRWSVNIQRQLPAAFVLEVAYVGNRGTRLPVNRNLNFVPAEYLSKSPARDQAAITFLGTQSPNPFFGLTPQFTSSTISRSGLLLPYPQFGNVTFLDPAGYSWYHSMQNRLEKRLTKGFTLQMAWTWSKAMEATEFLNASDPMPCETLGGIDRAHRFTGSGIWELPFGKGRKFGANMHRAIDFIAGGWQLSGAWQRQSGAPIGWGNIIINGDSTQLVLPSDQRNTDRWFNTSVFNRASTEQLASNLRTFPLRFSNVRLDSQRRWDFSLNKTFPLNERFKMRFRADAFNALNEPVLRGTDNTPANSTFGRITAQEPPRSFQFSLQLNF
ncbi:MAG: TonB-dependent receptor [Acidobacteria bacterium]|nr:TonB-dependent receptor [Acidobacteriota bacterium]